jgi:hypothetical protein
MRIGQILKTGKTANRQKYQNRNTAGSFGTKTGKPIKNGEIRKTENLDVPLYYVLLSATFELDLNLSFIGLYPGGLYLVAKIGGTPSSF